MAAAVTVSLGCCAGVAAADSTITATVYQPGKDPLTDSVTTSGLRAGADCPQYTGPTDGMTGGQGGGDLGATWSLPTVLGCLATPVAVADVTSITVFRADGAPEQAPSSLLSRADLQTPNQFENPLELPVISDDGDGVVYNRPPRSPSDDNAADQVTIDNPAAFAFSVFEGPALSVSVAASPQTVSQGATVSFSASVSPADQGALAYDWSFDGAAADSTQSGPQVAFADPGTYLVSLQVTDSDGGGGGSSVMIAVTGPSTTSPAAGTPSPGSGTNTSPSASPTGPTSSGGTGTGPAAKTPSPTTGQGKHKKRGQPNPSPSTHTNQPRSTATTHGHARRHRSGGSGATGSSGGASSGTAGGSATGPSAPATTPRQPAARPAGRARRHAAGRRHGPAVAGIPRVVTGLLVSDVTPLPAGSSPLVHEVEAAQGSSPAMRRGSPTSPLPIILSVAAVLGLIALGAVRELGNARGLRLG